jgi:serine/threonine protein kinase
MGQVYRARDTKLNRDVAIKVVADDFVDDPERLARFRREAQILAALNHPHIAAIYGFEDARDTQFLVMELVEGETVAARLTQVIGHKSQGTSHKAGLPLDEALAIARQVGEALQAAHEKGIIHRDLKPANIALTGRGAGEGAGLRPGQTDGAGIGDRGCGIRGPGWR